MGGRVTSKGHAVGCTDQDIVELILWAAGWRVVVKGVYPRHFSFRIFSGDEALEHTLQTCKTTARGARRDDMAGLLPKPRGLYYIYTYKPLKCFFFWRALRARAYFFKLGSARVGSGGRPNGRPK